MGQSQPSLSALDTPGDKAFNLLFRNPGQGHHWLTIKLVRTKSNRMGIRASIRIAVEDPGSVSRRIHRASSSGSGCGGNSLMQTIGSGRAARVARLEVDWPTGRVPTLIRGIPVERALEIVGGKEGYRSLDWTPIRRTAASLAKGDRVPAPTHPIR